MFEDWIIIGAGWLLVSSALSILLCKWTARRWKL